MSSSSRRKMGLRAGQRSESCSVRTYRPTPERENLDRRIDNGRGRQSPHSTSRSRSLADGVAAEDKEWLSGAYRDEVEGVGGGDLHRVSLVRPSFGRFRGRSGMKERMPLVGGGEGGDEYSSGGEWGAGAYTAVGIVAVCREVFRKKVEER